MLWRALYTYPNGRSRGMTFSAEDHAAATAWMNKCLPAGVQVWALIKNPPHKMKPIDILKQEICGLDLH